MFTANKFDLNLAALAILTAFTLSACGGGGGGGGSSSGGGGTTGPSTGRLNLSITDAPVDEAEKVVIAFAGVAIQPKNGQAQEFFFCRGANIGERVVSTTACDIPEPLPIDLLALQGGDSKLILDQNVPAGEYDWVRLSIADPAIAPSFIELKEDGRQFSLFISGGQTNLTLRRTFNVPPGGNGNYTIDFVLRNSVFRDPDQPDELLLRPTLRMVNNDNVGTIEGTVALALIQHSSCDNGTDNTLGNAVYVYREHDVTPVDIWHDRPQSDPDRDPITSSRVTMDDTGEFTYRVAFLSHGNYTIAFTCQGINDEPKFETPIEFVGETNVTVTAGQTTVHNF